MKTITLSTAIIGTGAAGYNAAQRLARTGDQNIAIFTMGVMNRLPKSVSKAPMPKAV